VILCSAIAVVGLVTAPSGGSVPAVRTEVAKLLALSPAEQDVYFLIHPEVTADYLNSTPKVTADWWNQATPEYRDDVIESLPELVGNLEGVDYASRDRANRASLRFALADARAALRAKPHSQRARLTVKCLTAIRSTITGRKSPHRFLIELTSASHPLAAVAIGDLDHSRQITFNLPGMGTLTDDMQIWAQSAQNVWAQQGRVGAPRKRAVVAWIGYVTPPVGVDAAFGDYAAKGSERFGTALRGLLVTRAKTPVRTLDVVAHSYGTTTAADALADGSYGVFAFVMLGSAGIEERISNVSAIHAEHVYAGEAADDDLAHWGRTSREDPRAPAFGATVIRVDGDRAAGLRPVTQHSPVLHSAWNDDPLSPLWTRITNTKAAAREYAAHRAAFGYLDDGTESLENIARVTTRGAAKPD
jgi:hypothetical protein